MLRWKNLRATLAVVEAQWSMEKTILKLTHCSTTLLELRCTRDVRPNNVNVNFLSCSLSAISGVAINVCTLSKRVARTWRSASHNFSVFLYETPEKVCWCRGGCTTTKEPEMLSSRTRPQSNTGSNLPHGAN